MEGREWVTYNPKRSDKTLGSFKINTVTGLWADFASGEKGDIIDLFCFIENTNINELLKKYNLLVQNQYDKKKPSFYSQKYKKKADKIYTYHSIDGEIIGYTCRFNHSDGKKDILPYQFDSEKNYFTWKGFKEPRPLYNQHLLNRNNCLIVEGEKTADYVQNILGNEWAVITWCGGCQSVKKTNWKILDKYEIIYIWPDNDEDGKMAAIKIKEIIGEKAQIVHLPEKLPKGWDLADTNAKEWPREKILSQLKYKPKKPKPVFRILGMSEGKNYFLSQNRVYSFSPSEIKKSNLLYLAPMSYWEDNYRGSKGVNWDSVANHLAQTSRSVNFFSEDMLRGRGAWEDNNKYLFHAGDKILLDNDIIELDDIEESKFIYELGRPIDLNLNKVLTIEEGNEFISMLSKFSWSNSISAILLAGWLVCAPICGALKWRSNAWISGEHGSGKSWILKNVVMRILKSFSICVQGSTTEAGIRQELKNDCLPIIFDEIENINLNAADRIEQILEMARISSSENDAKILKGGTSGKSVSYKLRTMFLFSSINVSLKQTADISRICILELKKSNDKKLDDLNNIIKYLSPEFCDKFIAKILTNMNIIIKNIDIFRERSGVHFANQRKGDQIGTLLGAGYSLTTDKIFTEKEAEYCIKSHNYSEVQIEDDIESDAEMCLKFLFSYSVRVGLENIPIGTLINYLNGNQDGLNNIPKSEVNLNLKIHGILFEENKIIIANKHPKLDQIFKGTQFDGGYASIIRRAKGAVSAGERRFASGIKSRAWSIPLTT